MHAYTHTHIHTYFHAYIHTYIHTYMYTDMDLNPDGTSQEHQQMSMDACARKDLLIGCGHVRLQAWDQSISVNIFECGHEEDMQLLTLAQLDADMYACGVHPTQLTQTQLQSLMNRHGVHDHVKKMVSGKLLLPMPVGPNPVKPRGNKAWCKKYSALQYVARRDLSQRDQNHHFNSNIRKLLEQYIKRTFFNESYIQRVLKKVYGHTAATLPSRRTASSKSVVVPTTTPTNVQLHTNGHEANQVPLDRCCFV